MSNESAKILSSKEKARTRINVYHDSANNWINIIKELIGNSIDVFNGRPYHNITITILDNKSIIYEDNGKGIPVEVESEDGELNYIPLFERDFAGTKYDYKNQTVGQNGVFLWTLAMTSEDIVFEITRPNHYVYQVAYHEGDRLFDLKVIDIIEDIKGKTGTKIIFTLDDKVWNKPNFTYEEICEIAYGQAAVSPLTTISVIDEQTKRKEIIHYQNGILDYFELKTNNKSKIFEPIKINGSINEPTKKIINGEAREVQDIVNIYIYFCYTNDNNEDFKKEFLNTADLIKYGTIQEGILYGIRSVVHKWLKKNGKYNKNEKQISLADVSTGLNYVADIKSFYIEYVGQSKLRTESPHYKSAISKYVEESLDVLFAEKKNIAELMCNQILLNKRVREKSDVDRSKYRKMLETKANSVFTRPEKFVDCRTKNPDERKLIIIEGDSALNIIKSSRNSYDTCIYPLKGKPLNPLKCSVDKILANQEIMDIYQSLGCGLTYNGKPIKGLPEFNIDNLNFNEILIMTDADVDGSHIKSLLITIFFLLSPELITQGKILILESPLYIISQKGKEDKWIYSETEYESIAPTLGSFTEKRYKGLGGLQPSVMAKVLSPEHRKVKKVLFDDVKKSMDTIALFMSNDTLDDRKEYISDNLNKYVTDLILEG